MSWKTRKRGTRRQRGLRFKQSPRFLDRREKKYGYILRFTSVTDAEKAAERLLREFQNAKTRKKKTRVKRIVVSASNWAFVLSRQPGLTDSERERLQQIGMAYAKAKDRMTTENRGETKTSKIHYQSQVDKVIAKLSKNPENMKPEDLKKLLKTINLEEYGLKIHETIIDYGTTKVKHRIRYGRSSYRLGLNFYDMKKEFGQNGLPYMGSWERDREQRKRLAKKLIQLLKSRKPKNDNEIYYVSGKPYFKGKPVKAMSEEDLRKWELEQMARHTDRMFKKVDAEKTKVKRPLSSKWRRKYVVASEKDGTISQHNTLKAAEKACPPDAKIFKRREDGTGRYLLYKRGSNVTQRRFYAPLSSGSQQLLSARNRKIINMLRKEKLSSAEIARRLGLRQTTVEVELRYLKKHGLVKETS